MSHTPQDQERERLRAILNAIESGEIVVKQGSGDVVSYIEGRIRAVDHGRPLDGEDEPRLSANG